MIGTTVTANACANIALVKYWGKRDPERNLPAAGSLSLTLDALRTETSVTFDPTLGADELVLDGTPAAAGELARCGAWLDLVRRRAGIGHRARVVTVNHFPTASGLASSASGYAALAVAASRAAGLALDEQELSILARIGSGSAARSIHGGFARMHAGTARDGHDAFATALPSCLTSDVRMVIGVVGGGVAKRHGSTDAMDHTAATSPLYPGWLQQVPLDLVTAEAALAAGDLEALGIVAEANALAMHATAIAARPAIMYWQPASLALLEQVYALRRARVPAWATMDAGPYVKVLTTASAAAQIAEALRSVPGCTDAIISASGPGAHVA